MVRVQNGATVLRTEYQDGVETGLREEFYLDGKPFAKGQMLSSPVCARALGSTGTKTVRSR
ncbi:MAG: hypothetical protein R3F17_14015 [Planctomycetota bacterium]